MISAQFARILWFFDYYFPFFHSHSFNAFEMESVFHHSMVLAYLFSFIVIVKVFFFFEKFVSQMKIKLMRSHVQYSHTYRT